MNDQVPEEKPQQGLEIISIYTKDISFESPSSPAIFQTNADDKRPEAKINIEVATVAVGEQVYECVLKLTVTAKIGEKNAYLVEIQQAGIFGLAGFKDEELNQMTGIYCPNVLLPFARESIADLVRRGGFPQLLIKPINFEALYKQQQEAAQTQQGNATH